MNKLLLVFCIFFTVNALFSQINIAGTIKDENNQSLSFCSVALLESKDSTLVKGSLTNENGNYIIEGVMPGNYLILASYIGYKDLYSETFEIKPENKTAQVDLKFSQSSIELKEIVVVAKKPLLEQKADRLVVNVANSAIAAGGTALEILKKVPGLVLINEKVTLGGSTNLQIWIDGKPSPYSDMNQLLRDMPGDQIDKIEVISQPGAQFDAAGGPILNIVLKRNADLGFKSTLSFTTAYYKVNHDDLDRPSQNYHRLNPSLNATYRSGKISLAGNASYNTGNYFTGFIVDRFIADEVYKSKNLDNSNYLFKNARVSADYFISDKTTTGLVLRAWGRNGDGFANNITNVFDKSQISLLNSFVTENTADSKRKGSYASYYIKHEFNRKTNHQLSFDLDYNQFKNRSINDLNIYKKDEAGNRSLSQQDVDQPVDIYVGKMDYSLPIDSTFKFQTGLKSSFASIDNDLSFYRNGKLSNQESNTFLYKENINAAYVRGEKSLGKVEISAGVRVEQTIVTGDSENKRILDRNYTQWFPSGSLIYKINKNLAIQSSYAKRVNRPGFQQQNPFSFFIDSLTYTKGNPQLRPEILNTSQLNFTYDNQPVFGISYSTTSDVIIENAPELEGTKTFTTSQNLANQKRLEIQLNFPIKLGKHIDGFGGNQAIYNSYDAIYQETTYKASRWHWLAYWEVTANLPKEIKFEIGGFYMTKFLEEFLTIDNLAGIDLGVSKTFADKRGRISLNYNDILYSQNTNATINFNNVNVNFFQREFSRNLRLTLSYQFGNTKVKGAATRSNASESESSRVKIN